MSYLNTFVKLVELNHFNHILTVLFKIRCGGVQKHYYFFSSFNVQEFMDLIIFVMSSEIRLQAQTASCCFVESFQM